MNHLDFCPNLSVHTQYSIKEVFVSRIQCESSPYFEICEIARKSTAVEFLEFTCLTVASYIAL